MTIAVMSDLHDNVRCWEIINKQLAALKIGRLINCGDTCAPDMLVDMAKTFSGHIDTVFGNVADRDLELSVVKNLKNVTHHGDQGTVVIESKKMFFNHFPAPAERMAKSGEVDLACHGHTHLKRWEPSATPSSRVPGKNVMKGKAMIVNPGTAGGMFQYPSFATIDLETMHCSFIDITL